MTRLVAGCMTGTSLDAIDAALVAIEGTGLAIAARLVRGISRPLEELAPHLRRLAEQEPMAAGEIADLSRRFALAHVEALRELLQGERPDLIAVHGQTVYHKPPVSWQLLNPAPIAHGLGTPVVFDLRAADLAAGGQGAPITPLSDWVLFGGQAEPLAIVNLGGFCNITLLPVAASPRDRGAEIGAIEGFDARPCNHILDAVARKMLGQPFDADGRHAAAGSVHDEALEDLEGILASRGRTGRSMGTGDETIEWVSRWRAHVAGPDLAATACVGIATAIVERIGSTRALLAGGGAKNRALVGAIASASAAPVGPVEPPGLAEYREAAAMAILGVVCRDRVPITLPRVTGVPSPAPVAGVWVEP